MTKLERMARAIYEESPAWLGPPGSPTCPGRITWEMLSDLSWHKRYGYDIARIKSFAQERRERALKTAKAALRAEKKP
jgi:hypothetical protein